VTGMGGGSAPAAAGTWACTALALVAVGVAGAAHARAVLSLRRRGLRWPVVRTWAAAAGLTCLAVGVLVPTPTFPAHVASHLLLAMAGPLLIVTSAPGTLLLRAVGPVGRRRVLRALHSRTLRALTWPWTALVLETGGVLALYLTPLWGVAHRIPVVSAVVMTHMVVAGLLFSAVVTGVDPLPRSVGATGVATRLAVLLVAAGAHDAMARLLQPRRLPAAVPAGQLRAGAELMSAGGAVVEVGLALAVALGWYARAGRDLARAQRRSVTGTADTAVS